MKSFRARRETNALNQNSFIIEKMIEGFLPLWYHAGIGAVRIRIL